MPRYRFLFPWSCNSFAYFVTGALGGPFHGSSGLFMRCPLHRELPETACPGDSYKLCRLFFRTPRFGNLWRNRRKILLRKSKGNQGAQEIFLFVLYLLRQKNKKEPIPRDGSLFFTADMWIPNGNPSLRSCPPSESACR